MKSQANFDLALAHSWRRRMGVEPTRDSDYCPADAIAGLAFQVLIEPPDRQSKIRLGWFC